MKGQSAERDSEAEQYVGGPLKTGLPSESREGARSARIFECMKHASDRWECAFASELLPYSLERFFDKVENERGPYRR